MSEQTTLVNGIVKMLSEKYLRSLSLALATLISAVACVDINEPTAPVLSDSEILSQLRMSTQSVMIQTGDSLRVSVVAIAMDGSEIQIGDPQEVIWTSEDSEQVRIDSNGYIHAVRPSATPVNVVASYKYHRTTKADTIPVYVTDDRFDVTQIRLVALDSVRVGPASSYGTYVLPRVRIDVYEGETLRIKGARLHIEVRSPIQLILSPSGGDDSEDVYHVMNERPFVGNFIIRSSGNVYGNEISDSLEFTGLYPMVMANPFGIHYDAVAEKFAHLFEHEYTPYVQPCGIVTVLAFEVPVPIDIVFSDSLNTGGCDLAMDIDEWGGYPDAVDGNIYDLPANSFAVGFRKTSTVGKVTWYARNANTKEPLNLSGSYISRIPE